MNHYEEISSSEDYYMEQLNNFLHFLLTGNWFCHGGSAAPQQPCRVTVSTALLCCVGGAKIKSGHVAVGEGPTQLSLLRHGTQSCI